MSYQFINASSPVNINCIIQGGLEPGARNCGSYYLSNITGTTKLNGTCLNEQFPGGYSSLVGRDLKSCASLNAVNYSPSSKMPRVRAMWLMALISMLAAILPYASAGPILEGSTHLGTDNAFGLRRHLAAGTSGEAAAASGSSLERRVEQSFVITSGPTRVEGATQVLGADVCQGGTQSVVYTGIVSVVESQQIPQAAAQAFFSTVKYPVAVANTTSANTPSTTTLTVDFGEQCGNRCGHVTFTTYFQRVVGDFRPGGPSGYQRDTPETVNGGMPNGRYNVTCT